MVAVEDPGKVSKFQMAMALLWHFRRRPERSGSVRMSRRPGKMHQADHPRTPCNLICKQGVTGSIPVSSTQVFAQVTELAARCGELHSLLHGTRWHICLVGNHRAVVELTDVVDSWVFFWKSPAEIRAARRSISKAHSKRRKDERSQQRSR